MPIETRRKSYVKTNQVRRAKLLNKICKELDYVFLMPLTAKMPCGKMAEIIKRLKEHNPMLNINMVNFVFKKFRAKKKVDFLGR